jgi:hypothetical protein
VADELGKRGGFDVKVEDGGRGEFTVLVDGREVARKQGDDLPPVEQVVDAVQRGGATAGAKS